MTNLWQQYIETLRNQVILKTVLVEELNLVETEVVGPYKRMIILD